MAKLRTMPTAIGPSEGPATARVIHKMLLCQRQTLYERAPAYLSGRYVSGLGPDQQGSPRRHQRGYDHGGSPGRGPEVTTTTTSPASWQ